MLYCTGRPFNLCRDNRVARCHIFDTSHYTVEIVFQPYKRYWKNVYCDSILEEKRKQNDANLAKVAKYEIRDPGTRAHYSTGIRYFRKTLANLVFLNDPFCQFQRMAKFQFC